MKDASLSFNFLIPDKDSKPNDTAFPTNKREYNIVASYTFENLSFGADFMYVEAQKSSKAGVPTKAKASGGALHLSYELKAIKLSGRVEYFRDNSDTGGTDLVGLGDGNKGWTFTITPAYKAGPLMVRAEVSYVKADKPFTTNGKKNQTRLGLEVGFLF
ncbi:MAG: porin [Aquificaceae bacterium]